MKKYIKVLLFVSISILISTPLYAKTVTPKVIPISSSEIINPDRGLYRWRNQELESRNAPGLEEYDRFEWSAIETCDGCFNFSSIDNALNAAKSRGHKFAFRVRAMKGYEDMNAYIPSYLKSEPHGWYADYDHNGSDDTFVPNWNDATLLSKMDRFIKALGSRYNGNKYIAWVDIGMMGQYGEWAIDECKGGSDTTCIDYTQDSYSSPTLTSKKKIVDSYAQAFPNQQLVLAGIVPEYPDIVAYTLSKSTSIPIGWRSDCLGQSGFFDWWKKIPTLWNAVGNRWKVAPVVGEYCTNGSFSVANSQIKDMHFTSAGNGNIPNYSGLSSSLKNSFYTNGKTLGYRFELLSVTIPDSTSTNKISIGSKFRNVGVAPVYNNWNVTWRMLDSSRKVVASSNSKVNLRSVSLISSSGVTFSDTLTFPSTLSKSKYTLNFIITDPEKIRKPMKLAIEGVKSDGSYDIGTFEYVSATTTTTTNTTTNTGSTSNENKGEDNSTEGVSKPEDEVVQNGKHNNVNPYLLDVMGVQIDLSFMSNVIDRTYEVGESLGDNFFIYLIGLFFTLLIILYLLIHYGVKLIMKYRRRRRSASESN